jgi:Ribonuclease G/E
VILRTAQWALDARRVSTSLTAFREKLLSNTTEMLDAIRVFQRLSSEHRLGHGRRILLTTDARYLHQVPAFAKSELRADLVLTSPPYPGIHAVYNRWQVDGRRETPAPYWIAASQDGNGLSYYTFADRKKPALGRYFQTAGEAFRSVRAVMRQGAYLVQVVAFSDRANQLPRYLSRLSAAGFEEVLPPNTSRASRIWRDVPNRKWHAVLQGATASSREVVLVHRAL